MGHAARYHDNPLGDDPLRRFHFTRCHCPYHCLDGHDLYYGFRCTRYEHNPWAFTFTPTRFLISRLSPLNLCLTIPESPFNLCFFSLSFPICRVSPGQSDTPVVQHRKYIIINYDITHVTNNKIVAPKLRHGNFENRLIFGKVASQFANAAYVQLNCKTPISMKDDAEFSGQTCISIEHAGQA